MIESKLECREGVDEQLTPEQLARFEVFAQMERPPTFNRLFDSLALRRYELEEREVNDAFCVGPVVCEQGAAGFTAYYIPTTKDLLELRRSQLEALSKGKAPADEKSTKGSSMGRKWTSRDLAAEIDALVRRSETDRIAAMVSLKIGQKAAAPARGWLDKWTRWLFSKRSKPARSQLIPVDGPTYIDSETFCAPMVEGDVFGEISCLTRAPRSATVSVTRDWYILEMTSVVLNQMMKDKQYLERMQSVYEERIMRGHLRRMSLFEHLSDAQFDALRGTIKHENFQPGEVIFEEGEPSDCIYVIRSGLVKVLMNVSSLARRDELNEETCRAFCRGLAARSDAASAATPIGKLWRLLPAPWQRAASTIADESVPIDADAALEVVNALIKSPGLPLAFGKKRADILKAVDHPAVRAAVDDLNDDVEKWSGLETRQFNRALLSALFPNTISSKARLEGPRRTLNYLSRGDFFGEMGVMARVPRSATCVAYDHPDSGQKLATGLAGVEPLRVELVRIDADVFRALVDETPALKAVVDELVAKYRRDTRQRLEAPPGEAPGSVQFSPRFEELGLFQGQKLMLVDLDRCTRCGECVDACIATHDDGRTRLFLDGPRFGKYLVPLTCRQCLDPVCLIGCPAWAIHRGDNGEIIIRDWCIGCETCAKQCPYGSIQMHDLLDWEPRPTEGNVTLRAVVCDLCSSLPGQAPACVKSCPHDAAFRMNARNDLDAELKRR